MCGIFCRCFIIGKQFDVHIGEHELSPPDKDNDKE